MTVLPLLLGLAVVILLAGLAVLRWSLRNGQYDDPKGAALRILNDEADDIEA